MSLDKIHQLVSSLAKSLDDNEKLATPIICNKLAKSLELYPQDQTLGSLFRVIDKMASNNVLFIKRADFRNLYNKFYNRNTKTAEIFQNELGDTNNVTDKVKLYERDESASLSVDTSSCADPILANALSGAFSNTQINMYSKKTAAAAIKEVSSTLDSWNLKPAHLLVEDGNEKFLVVRADFETPKGLTGVYFPIQANLKSIEASVFVGNGSVQDLNNSNLKSYIRSEAGNKLKTNAGMILGLLTNASIEKREISDAELALLRVNASKQVQSPFFANQITGQTLIENKAKQVELPKLNEFSSYEKMLTTSAGEASMKFGLEKVKIGRDVITRELQSFGFNHVQTNVSSSTDNTIYYDVSINSGKIGFTVPIKIESNRVTSPSLILVNGSVLPLSKESIDELHVGNKSDYRAAAVASPLYSLKPSELVQNIKEAMASDNHDMAQDALNVLANSGDRTAYLMGFDAFKNGLLKTASAPVHSCNMIIKNSTSQHPICGHTGLPVHKTYIDKQGSCRPLYRKGFEEASGEGAMFMAHKILG